MMQKLEYRVSFTTPAFLGNAEQSGQWRTPPFKALLRQWWRVAYAAEHGFPRDTRAMRHAEGLLFGSAADGSGNRSLVRIRLDRWSKGTLSRWESLPKVVHPEVNAPVDSGLYLAFGPVVLPRGQHQPALKSNAAIQAGEAASLSLAFPSEHVRLIGTALTLMDHYGTGGGRSRNGWGSFSLTPREGTPALQGEVPLRTWQDALDLDWPHAIGRDERGPLIWQTEPSSDGWKALMSQLAVIKIALRTQFPFTTGKNAASPEARHWLSYPVTNHNVASWRQARLPNSLRFKARPTSDGKLVGVIFHVPCRPPPLFRPDPGAIERVWQQVHSHLDQSGLQRVPA